MKTRPATTSWQRMPPFQLTNTQTVSFPGICGKNDAGAILGSSRPTCGTPHIQGDHRPVSCISTSLGIIWEQPSYQNIVACSVLASYFYITTQGRILSVWQLRRSRTFNFSVSLILHTHLTLPLVTATYSIWATQVGSRWKDFPIRRRSARGGAWVAIHAAKGFLIMRNPGVSESSEDKHWMQQGLC